jgi:hypothetical protein
VPLGALARSRAMLKERRLTLTGTGDGAVLSLHDIMESAPAITAGSARIKTLDRAFICVSVRCRAAMMCPRVAP